MNLFKFLFYCVYISTFFLNKKSHNGILQPATGLFAIPLYVMSIPLYLISVLFLPKDFININLYSLIVILTIYFGINKFCKYYFIKKENYKVAIALFENKINNRNAVIVVLLYYIFSFIFLVVIAENGQNIRGFLGQ